MFEDLKPFTEVILHTNNEWNNLHGLVDEIIDDKAYIFCVQFLWYRYEIIKNWNKNDFEIVNN